MRNEHCSTALAQGTDIVGFQIGATWRKEAEAPCLDPDYRRVQGDRPSHRRRGRRGQRVVATARYPQSLDGLDVDQRLRLEVTDQASVDGAMAETGEIDVSISNAGTIFAAAVEASPIAEIERLFTENTAGAIRVTQAVLLQMRQRRKGRLLSCPASLGGPCSPALPPTRPRSGRSKPSRKHWPSSSAASASMSVSSNRGRSALAPWTTCARTTCPTTVIPRCLRKVAPLGIRVVRFTDVTPERVGQLIAAIDEAGGPSPGVPVTGLQLLLDEAQGTAVVLQLSIHPRTWAREPKHSARWTRRRRRAPACPST